MDYLLHESDASPGPSAGETRLFGLAHGCPQFEQRLLRFAGASDERTNPAEDEVLYVLSGTAAATVGDEHAKLEPGTAAFVSRGTPWRIDDADELEVLSVLVRDPRPVNGSTHAVVAVDSVESGVATAGREFRLLATPDLGCESATQFVGYIPGVRPPDHGHKYGGVVFVLDGQGALHVGGESA